jgi:hypothetical protein
MVDGLLLVSGVIVLQSVMEHKVDLEIVIIQRLHVGEVSVLEIQVRHNLVEDVTQNYIVVMEFVQKNRLLILQILIKYL